ncbi:MAG: hydrolase [Planctomycetota bacterium]
MSRPDPNDLLSYLSPLDKQSDEMLRLVLELCNQNSGTFNTDGLSDVANILLPQLEELEGEIQVRESKPMTAVDDSGMLIERNLGSMIHVIKYPEAEFKVLLCIHMDTVYPPDHPFQQCQRLDNGHINGPGVADAKGGLVVLMHALKLLESSPFAGKIGWEVLINADEEIGSPGSVDVMAEIAQRCDVGLLFEPSLPDGTLVSWRKGSGNFTFVVRGKAAHAGREFENGRNAIVALARLIDEIDCLNTDPDVTFNAGMISGGTALNVVPDLAIGRVNCRVRTPEQQHRVEEVFERLIRKHNQQDGIQIEMHGSFSSPPKPMGPDVEDLQRRIESCGRALGQPVGWRGTGGACDGNKFSAAGLPNIDTLGPKGGNIHSDREYLIPDSLVTSSKLAALILLTYAAEN